MIVFVNYNNRLFSFYLDKAVKVTSFDDISVTFKNDNGEWFIEKRKLSMHQWVEIKMQHNDFHFWLTYAGKARTYYSLQGQRQLLITGVQKTQKLKGMIGLPYFFGKILLVQDDCDWRLILLKDDYIFVNNRRIFSNVAISQTDTIMLAGYKIICNTAVISIEQYGGKDICTNLNKLSLFLLEKRTINQSKSYFTALTYPKQITLEEPVEEPKIGINLQAIMMPLTSLVMLGITCLVQQQLLFFITGGLTTVITLVFNLFYFFYEKRKKDKVKNSAQLKIEENLVKSISDVNRNIQEMHRTIHEFYPQMQQLIVQNIINDGGIFKRTDAPLQLRVGTRTVFGDVFLMLCDALDMYAPYDKQLQAIQKRKHLYPVLVDRWPLGVVGSKEVLLSHAKQYLLQTAYFYHMSVYSFIYIGTKENWEQLGAAQRLPQFHHFSDHIVKHVILSDATQWKDELTKIEKYQTYDTTHTFIFFICDEDNTQLVKQAISNLEGVQIWFVSQQLNLPTHIATNILLRDNQTAEFITNDTKQLFELDSQLTDTAYARMSLYLSNIDETMTHHNQIQTTDFWSLFPQIYTKNEIRMLALWPHTLARNTQAVPIGRDAAGEVLSINLHEAAQGPHALIAGMTGSGKTELLFTFLLSLVLHFHPKEIGLLFIDYKGGGLAQYFERLPHHMGTMTNLSQLETNRVLESIQAELDKRQQLFKQYKLTHIHQYQVLYDEGVASELLPSVYIVVDEFAELKEKFPAFLDALISIARIGRSLGLHLLLATQRPSGIISDQIWSNCQTKICLKVASESDSQDVIKTKDAAYIVNSGEGYLKVGERQSYQHFQSAWTGGKCSNQTTAIKGVKIINSRKPQHTKNEEQQQTVLEDTLVSILKNTTALKIAQNPRILIPPLPQHVSWEALSKMMLKNAQGLPIGIIDYPRKQKQFIHCIFKENQLNHVAIIGDKRFGAEDFLQGLLKTISQQLTSNALQIYIIDSDMGGDLPVQKQYVKENISIQQTHEVEELILLMSNEIAKRSADSNDRQAFHNRPNFVLVLKHFDIMLLDSNAYKLEQFIMRNMHQLNALRMYIILHGSSIAQIKQNLLDKIEEKYFLYHDAMVNMQYLPRHQMTYLQPIVGRGVTYIDGDIFSIQLAMHG